MGNLMTASREWASRPDDERFVSLPDLHEHVRSRMQRAEVLISTTKAIAVKPEAGEGISIETERGKGHFTNWSFGQLCQIAKAPSSYLSSLPAVLSTINLQYGLDSAKRENTMVLMDRKEDDITVRSFNSETYGRIWDLDVVNSVEKINQDNRWVIPSASYQNANPKRATTLYSSDRDVFIFLVDPNHPIEISGETLFRGFIAYNSEVGKCTFGLMTFLYRYICDNRIIWGAQDVKELKIRHTSGGPSRFIAEGEKALRAYSESSPSEIQAQIIKAKSLEVGTNDKDVSQWLQDRGFTGIMSKRIVETAQAEEGSTHRLWDIVNGITAYARSITHTDTRLKMEETAGSLLSRYAA